MRNVLRQRELSCRFPRNRGQCSKWSIRSVGQWTTCRQSPTRVRRSRCFAGPWLWPQVRSFHDITKESTGRVEVVLKRVVGVQRSRMTLLKITVILMGVSRCNFSKVKTLDEVLASDSGKRLLWAELLQRPGRPGSGTGVRCCQDGL